MAGRADRRTLEDGESDRDADRLRESELERGGPSPNLEPGLTFTSFLLALHLQGIMVVHVLLFIFDHLPFTLIAFSLAAHAVYLTNFTPQWPFISLTSPRFLLSCVMVVADHFLWFFHFAEKAQEAKAKRQPRYRYGAKTTKGLEDAPSFMDVAAFFAICVWLVPLFLFLSLSANDNVLPSQGESRDLVVCPVRLPEEANSLANVT
jgi:hypothetical protein